MKDNKNKNAETFDTNEKNGIEEKNFPGINNPDIELPAVNPPVPNRAWTEMRRALTEEKEK